MKKFTFKHHTENELESILSSQKKKLRRQQVLFSTIFTMLVCFVVYYLADKYLYAEFDGYISVDTITRRAYNPIYITQIERNEGDIVNEGDTLFTYITLDFFTNVSNRSFGSTLESNYMTALEKLSSVNIEIKALKEKIALMEENLKVAENNVKYGLYTNVQINSLKRDILENKNHLKECQLSQAEYNRIINDYQEKMHQAGLNVDLPTAKTLRYVNEHLSDYGRAVGYAISTTDAIVNKVYTSVGSVILTGESIMQLQSLNIYDIDLHCEAYVMNNDITNIYAGKSVKIIINDDVSYKGVVSSISLRIEQLPKEYESTFYRDNNAMCAIIKFDEGTVIPLAFVTDKLPVRIRTMRRHSKDRIENSLFRYTTLAPVIETNSDTIP